MSTPETRSLAVVLRHALDDSDRLRLLVASSAGTAVDSAHLDVVMEGVTVSVPKLKGVTVPAGQPVYLLASSTFMLAIGTVSTTP